MPWRRWLCEFWARRSVRRPGRQTRLVRYRPLVEQLEERLVPSTNVLVNHNDDANDTLG